MYKTDFSAFLRTHRAKNNLSQQDIASKLSISEKEVDRWEQGKGYPVLPLLNKLANILNVSVDDLINTNEESVRNTKVAISPKRNKEFKRFFTAKNLTGVISLVFMLAITVCLIVNFAISGTLNWAYYPLGSIFLAWCIIVPVINLKKHKLAAALLMITILDLS